MSAFEFGCPRHVARRRWCDSPGVIPRLRVVHSLDTKSAWSFETDEDFAVHVVETIELTVTVLLLRTCKHQHENMRIRICLSCILPRIGRCIEAVMRQKMLALHAPSEFAKARGRASAPGVLHNISGLEPLMAPPAGFAVVAGSDPRSHQEDGVRPDSVAAAFAAETMLSTPGLDYSIDEEMPDNFVAAEDWLDVTHAMLNNIDP